MSKKPLSCRFFERAVYVYIYIAACGLRTPPPMRLYRHLLSMSTQKSIKSKKISPWPHRFQPNLILARLLMGANWSPFADANSIILSFRQTAVNAVFGHFRKNFPQCKPFNSRYLSTYCKSVANFDLAKFGQICLFLEHGQHTITAPNSARPLGML